MTTILGLILLGIVCAFFVGCAVVSHLPVAGCDDEHPLL